MSEHADKAEESAERAGGYLQTAEIFGQKAIDYGEEKGDPDGALALAATANAYAQMSTAAATLSLAQRVAANGDG